MLSSMTQFWFGKSKDRGATKKLRHYTKQSTQFSLRKIKCDFFKICTREIETSHKSQYLLDLNGFWISLFPYIRFLSTVTWFHASQKSNNILKVWNVHMGQNMSRNHMWKFWRTQQLGGISFFDVYTQNGFRVWIWNLNWSISVTDIERTFELFWVLKAIWKP